MNIDGFHVTSNDDVCFDFLKFDLVLAGKKMQALGGDWYEREKI